MGKKYGMVVDLNRCIGCHTCSIACKAENGIEKGTWINVSTVGGRLTDTPAGTYPDLTMSYLPKCCMHCDKAACMDVCPNGAIHRREDGIVLIMEETCDGCQSCMEACPYAVIQFNEKKGFAEKCNFCYESVDEGLEPFCVRCCGTKAMYFGDLSDPQSPVSKLIREKRAYCLLPDKGTMPAIYYFGPSS